MKIKSFDCPKSITNYEKKILGTSDSWSMSRLSHQPSESAYYNPYIVDCLISGSMMIVWKAVYIKHDGVIFVTIYCCQCAQ